MNYIQIINQFWQIRRSKIISSSQADVYKFIIHESNMRSWENPLRITNGTICSSIGISEKTLIDARNVLQQIGLIKINKGITKKQAPTYLIVDYWNYSSNQVSFEGGNHGGNEGGNHGGNEVYINNKQNKKKTKPNSETKVSAPRPNSPPKKETTEFWTPLVDLWFKFNEDNLKITPSFKGSDPADLKKIIETLQKRAKTKGFDWNEQHALDTFSAFLQHSHSDQWLKNNFLLSNLLKQFDKIITPANGNGNTKNNKSDLSDYKRKLAEKMAGNTGQSQ